VGAEAIKPVACLPSALALRLVEPDDPPYVFHHSRCSPPLVNHVALVQHGDLPLGS
jgi:hypothetical protein